LFEYNETTKKILAEIDKQHQQITDSLFVSASKLGTPNTTIKHSDLIRIEQEIKKVSSKFAKQKVEVTSMSIQYGIIIDPIKGLIITPVS
jgi:phosphoribosylaminoimidazole-succinocarboxamide synthase